MTIDKRQVGRRFDRHASSYDDHAHVQQAMADRLMERVAATGVAPAGVLELGCGTGYLTERLVRRFPGARITAVDLADGMVRAARERLGPGARVELAVADVEEVPWDGRRFDLVVSNATIQWLAAPAATMASLGRALAPGGVMLHATFGPQTFRELFTALDRVEAARALPSRRHGLTLLAAAEWAELLRAGGLVD
ncbi:MAG: methyltransferase domain-containing protein, partial [Actinomycetota bacterium]